VVANSGRPLTTRELLGVAKGSVSGPDVTAVADVTILRDVPIRWPACTPGSAATRGCGFGVLAGTHGTPTSKLVFAADAVAALFPQDTSPVSGALAFTVAGGGLRLEGAVASAEDGAYLTPITEDGIAGAEDLPIGALIAVDGWLEVLGWGVPCPMAPGVLGREGMDSPFVRCPGGWITRIDAPPADAPGTVTMHPDAPAIPVQASAYETFAPDAQPLETRQVTPIHATYLLRRVPNPEPGATPAAGWLVVGRLDPIGAGS
jgi:hypothetical protein